MRASRWLLLLNGVTAACSFVEPHQGSTQALCGIAAGGSGQTGASAAYYGVPMMPAAGPSCSIDSDDPCDVCEITHCCATRSACYGDPTCACADVALDQCLDVAETSADEAASSSQCWSAFTAKGSVEQARVTCQRAWCKTECAEP